MTGALPRIALDFLRAEDGPTAVEYAALLSFIILACVLGVQAIGNGAVAVFSEVGSQLGQPPTSDSSQN
jgi:pilus assembly protein Flp/PilA